MRDFTVDNVIFEITDEKSERLLETSALIESESGTLYLNTEHAFTYEEVLLLLNASEED